MYDFSPFILWIYCKCELFTFFLHVVSYVHFLPIILYNKMCLQSNFYVMWIFLLIWIFLFFRTSIPSLNIKKKQITKPTNRAKRYQYTFGTKTTQHIAVKDTKDEYLGYHLIHLLAQHPSTWQIFVNRIRGGMSAKSYSSIDHPTTTRTALGSI